MTTDFKTAIEPSLTLDNAQTYAMQRDQWLWVVNSILDPLDISPTEARIAYIEDRFDAINAEHLRYVTSKIRTYRAANQRTEAIALTALSALVTCGLTFTLVTLAALSSAPAI
jgi:hypothetical protein